MKKSIFRKATVIDHWYTAYTKNCGHRIHIADKKWAHRKYRRLNKNITEND